MIPTPPRIVRVIDFPSPGKKRKAERITMQPMNIIQQSRRTGRRPVDKLIIVVNKDTIAGSQVQTILTTATFPCTVVGLRWQITAAQDGGTTACIGEWAIIILRDGQTAGTLVLSDQGTMFQPEQDVLTWGMWNIDNNTQTKMMEGDTKTMRKLLGGDRLVFIAIGVATQTTKIQGIIQFFCKT